MGSPAEKEWIRSDSQIIPLALPYGMTLLIRKRIIVGEATSYLIDLSNSEITQWLVSQESKNKC